MSDLSVASGGTSSLTAASTRARIIRLRAARLGFEDDQAVHELVAAATNGRVTTVDQLAVDRNLFGDYLTVCTRLERGPLTTERDDDGHLSLVDRRERSGR